MARCPFAEIQTPDWNPVSISDANQVLLPFPLEQVANRAVAAGLTSRQRAPFLRTALLSCTARKPNSAPSGSASRSSMDSHTI